jgi:hypothetical protein
MSLAFLKYWIVQYSVVTKRTYGVKSPILLFLFRLPITDTSSGRSSKSNISIFSCRRVLFDDFGICSTLCWTGNAINLWAASPDCVARQPDVLSLFKVQWLLYLPLDLTFRCCTVWPQSDFMCLVWISEQTAIISLYGIKWLVFITETECVYCAVRAGSSKSIQVSYISGNGTANTPCNGLRSERAFPLNRSAHCWRKCF